MSGLPFVSSEKKNNKTQKTGLHTDLLLTYDCQLRSLISLKPSLLKSHDGSYYVKFNV